MLLILSFCCVKLSVVSEWLIDKKLSQHLGKTKSFLFRFQPRLGSKSVLNISCKVTATEGKSSVKNFGATLEQCLSGETMLNSIIQKANARLKFLYQEQRF